MWGGISSIIEYLYYIVYNFIILNLGFVVERKPFFEGFLFFPKAIKIIPFTFKANF
jgi:hypothetical protein